MRKSPTFAYLLDLAIRAGQASTGKQLTQFIKDLTEGSNLNSAVISRMRKHSDFPDNKLIKQLIELLPESDFLDPATIPSRLLLPWSSVQREQNKLPDNTEISIVSGWQLPKAINDNDIARSIAINISKGFIYTFIYPHQTTYVGEEKAEDIIEEWKNKVITKISVQWLNYTVEIGTYDQSSFDRIVVPNQDKIIESIRFKHTIPESNFWFKLPAPYCVFHNIGLKEKQADYRYGIFNTRGMLMNDSDQNCVFSEGWLRTTEEQFNDIEESYISECNQLTKNKE